MRENAEELERTRTAVRKTVREIILLTNDYNLQGSDLGQDLMKAVESLLAALINPTPTGVDGEGNDTAFKRIKSA